MRYTFQMTKSKAYHENYTKKRNRYLIADSNEPSLIPSLIIKSDSLCI